MDDASEDSRPAQPGFIKKFFLTISTVRDSLAMLLFFYSWCDHHLNSLNSLEFIFKTRTSENWVSLDRYIFLKLCSVVVLQNTLK